MIWTKNQRDHNGWKKVDDYHVTSLFLGKDAEKMNHEIYQNHQDGEEVSIEILALVVVPNKIITGICFPEYQVANRCPHVTLMTNEWKPAQSNNLLEEACTRGTKSPFSEAYEELKQTGKVKEDHQVLTGQVKVDQKSASSSCYLIVLDAPVSFTGVSKKYF